MVYLGEIAEQRSLIRETDRDQPAWRIYVSVHKGWAACGEITVIIAYPILATQK